MEQSSPLVENQTSNVPGSITSATLPTNPQQNSIESPHQQSSNPNASTHKLQRYHSCCKHKMEAKLGLYDPTPSPIVYNVKYLSIAEGRPGAGCSLTSRHPPQTEETPSPSAYNAGSAIGTCSPSWTIGAKVNQPEEFTPGPGDYSPDFIKWKMANKPSFTMRCKTGPPLFFTKENPPSANTYFPQLDRSNMAASLKGRHKETKIQKTPGPSSYLISTDTLTGPQFSIVGRGEEPEFIDAPGPSSYTPQSNSILSKSPTFILGTRLNPLKVVDSSPGPVYKPIVGTFHQNSGPKVTLKSRHFPQTKIITPGPGDYDISNLDHDILHPIHTKKPSSSKSSSSKLNTPPTPSTPPDSSLKPTSENEKLKCRLPGPADYTIGKASRLVWRTAPGFSLGSRLQVRVNSTGPAPNTYSVKVQSPGKSASMKGKFSENVLVFPSLRQNTLRV